MSATDNIPPRSTPTLNEARLPADTRLASRLRTGVRRIPGIQASYEALKNRRRIQVLKEHIAAGGVGAELGVHKGQFSRVMLRELQPDRLHLVDPWYLLGASWQWAGGDRSTARALARIIRQNASHLATGRVLLSIDDDVRFLEALPEESLDWAYIDSSHQYDHTKAEIELLATRVSRGGIIAGDDWQRSATHRHGGVARAVREFVEATDAVLLYSDDRNRQWVVRLPG